MGAIATGERVTARIVETTSMSENGRLVLPAAVRKAAGIRPKEVLTVRVDEEGVHIQTRRQALAKAQAVVQKLFGPGRSPSAELIAERRLEAKKEERGG